MWGKWATVLITVIGLLVATAFAQLQQPSPPPVGEQQRQTQPNPTQQNPTANQQNPAQPPIVVNVLPAQKTEAERAEDVRERQEKAGLDRRLVAFTADLANYTARLYYATLAVAVATVCLVLATAVLGVFGRIQSHDMKASIEVSRKSAEAAQKAAETAENSFVLEQRPWLRWNLHRTSLKLAGRHIRADLSINFENIGKTPAMNVLPSARLFVVSRDEAVLNVGMGHHAEMATYYRNVPLSFTCILPMEKPTLNASGTIEIASLPKDRNEQFTLYLAFYTGYRFVHSGTLAEIATVYQMDAKTLSPTVVPGKGGQPLIENLPLTLDVFDTRPTIPVIPMEMPGRRIT